MRKWKHRPGLCDPIKGCTLLSPLFVSRNWRVWWKKSNLSNQGKFFKPGAEICYTSISLSNSGSQSKHRVCQDQKYPEFKSSEVPKSSLLLPLLSCLLWKEKYRKVLRGSPDWRLLFDTHLMSCLTTVTKINESSHSCNYHIADHSIVLDYHGLLLRNIYTMTTV